MIPLTSPALSAPIRDASAIWKQIEAGVRESCVMRCEGREREAAAMVQATLPSLIREWSEGSGRPAEECREELRTLFAKAQEQVAAALFSRRLVLASLQADHGRTLTEGALRLHRRIPIADVPAMLDALQESERQSAPRRKNFPSTASRPKSALAAA